MYRIIIHNKNNTNNTNNTEYDYNNPRDFSSMLLFVFIIIFIFGFFICACTFCRTENSNETINETTNEIVLELLPIYTPRLPSYKSEGNVIILITDSPSVPS